MQEHFDQPGFGGIMARNAKHGKGDADGQRCVHFGIVGIRRRQRDLLLLCGKFARQQFGDGIIDALVTRFEQQPDR